MSVVSIPRILLHVFLFVFLSPSFSPLIAGLFLEHCLSTMRSLAQDADFVMAIGDDSSDEPMFQVSVCATAGLCVY